MDKRVILFLLLFVLIYAIAGTIDAKSFPPQSVVTTSEQVAYNYWHPACGMPNVSFATPAIDSHLMDHGGLIGGYYISDCSVVINADAPGYNVQEKNNGDTYGWELNQDSYPAETYDALNLCTVMVHEFGHAAGYRDPDNPSDPYHSHDPRNVMYWQLDMFFQPCIDALAPMNNAPAPTKKKHRVKRHRHHYPKPDAKR